MMAFHRASSQTCRLLLLSVCWLLSPWCAEARADELRAGFAHQDITPEVSDTHPVWLGGYGPGRQATGVHDPLFVRCVVLATGDQKIALVSLDSIGVQYPLVQQIRGELPDFQHVLVSSTHNHETPDVVGIWGRTPLHRGADDAYLQLLVERTVEAVRQAAADAQPAVCGYGTAEDESLIRDSRLPEVKDGVLRVLSFTHAELGKPLGILVQWNCHPEALGAGNLQITADFTGSTIRWLEAKRQVPVVYFTGVVGGLMAPPRERIYNDDGTELREGDFEYARRYGEQVGQLAERALQSPTPLALTPFRLAIAEIGIPVTNPWYRVARSMGVVRRSGRVWTGDPEQLGEPLQLANASKPMAVVTEVGVLQLGDLRIAAVPGEIYPELVYGRYQDPVDPAADFPDAPLEPTVQEAMGERPWMLFGLANDELGYIIPKRQWDLDAPFAYGRNRAQYGEINSCGVDAAPIIMGALSKCAARLDQEMSLPAVKAIAP